MEGFLSRVESDPRGSAVMGMPSSPVPEGQSVSHEDNQLEYQGLGSKKKRRVVKDFLSSEKPDVVMIQETKKEECDRRLVGSVWSARNKEWAALPASGASGGILIIWDSKKLRREEVVLGSFSVSIKFAIDGRESLWLSAVYGPNNSALRKDFWVELSDIAGSLIRVGVWAATLTL
ncbi:hypothetical protein CK203_053703 [Vitis vinifera]|uniref:Endonuclease/exonuclease/phosphatase domain-containing protein n=1 Tax=Vitis vinifera TaxID=29760 RepID=A0A438GS66_VITVI|nr:hypothetical protein CK203_053703 [Vitis vinifera]